MAGRRYRRADEARTAGPSGSAPASQTRAQYWTAAVEEAEIMKKVHLHSDASALARKYFPLPGAEKSKHSFHGYRFLFKICFGFSSPTSLNDCLGCSVRIMLDDGVEAQQLC
ncbi:Hypothetical_protein [Hexamita inflata]|uniref:Hypothetical_protein n=1 Tax=Hexamita inflata TaxID=28002 RepID=A0AA86PAT2_9EUKA|nr:Hypothetical protein HINF_LOCUS21926 [Hexamita inflata]